MLFLSTHSREENAFLKQQIGGILIPMWMIDQEILTSNLFDNLPYSRVL